MEKKTLMVEPRKLPPDMEEEILFLVPYLSLVRFRAVCKEWNNLFNTKIFVNRKFAFSHQEFMLKTHSHIYSLSVDLNDNPTIKVTDLRFDSRFDPSFDSSLARYDISGFCDGYVLMKGSKERCFVWNPLLRQTYWISSPMGDEICDKRMGHDGGNPEKSYKLIGRFGTDLILLAAMCSHHTTRLVVSL
ncbi:putative F-box protein At1g58090 [Capsella rubella]|uniref:putative F-box protein At1g58090 n=1 Tax=Capsella rubella TaxID=81985 RepID=UPI000CD538CD|nr:putative F-box protein At1g58090 [Capsella rubella]